MRSQGVSCQDCWRRTSRQTVFSISYIEGITLGGGEEVDEVAGGASGMGVDRISEVADQACVGQAAGVYL